MPKDDLLRRAVSYSGCQIYPGSLTRRIAHRAPGRFALAAEVLRVLTQDAYWAERFRLAATTTHTEESR